MSEHTNDTTVDVSQRLARVAPRITYVILCWEHPHNEAYYPGDEKPDAILGPFTEREARAMADTLTCECEVTMVSTSPPFWCSQPQP